MTKALAKKCALCLEGTGRVNKMFSLECDVTRFAWHSQDGSKRGEKS